MKQSFLSSTWITQYSPRSRITAALFVSPQECLALDPNRQSPTEGPTDDIHETQRHLKCKDAEYSSAYY